MTNEANMTPFLQMSSIGLLWTFFHCAPMCGPIVGGLRLNQGSMSSTLHQLTLYQSGRAMMYMIFGIIAGSFGGFVLNFNWMGFLLSFVLLVAAIQTQWKLIKSPLSIQSLYSQLGEWVKKSQGRWRAFHLGIIFSFLPCGLVAWSLGLAGLTGNPLNGALIMLYLVLLTSLPLAVALLAGRQLRFKYVPESAPLFISSLWTFLMSAAAQDWIEHFKIKWTVFGKTIHLMFW